jgi:hypothetical protein
MQINLSVEKEFVDRKNRLPGVTYRKLLHRGLEYYEVSVAATSGGQCGSSLPQPPNAATCRGCKMVCPDSGLDRPACDEYWCGQGKITKEPYQRKRMRPR